jgi:cytidylate kinase
METIDEKISELEELIEYYKKRYKYFYSIDIDSGNEFNMWMNCEDWLEMILIQQMNEC